MAEQSAERLRQLLVDASRQKMREAIKETEKAGIILDEPTSGLDPVSRDELLEVLSGYIEDGAHSVLFSTHITSDLEKIADYITYLHLGSMIFTGSKEDFVDGYRIVTGDKELLDSHWRKN